jgi:hypothetical protein
MAEVRKIVFVSYAHEDRKWADELVTFLAPWIRDKRVQLWDDSQIEAGEIWRVRIETAIEQASVAVLLVSKYFFASKFIAEHELPRLLKRVEQREIRLMWIAVGHSVVQATPLAEFQAVNNPSRPLEALNVPERNKVLADIAQKIANAVTMHTFAGGLRVIDETVEPLEAALEQRPERADRTFRVQAQYEPDRDRISFSGAGEVITADDLTRLPEADREFIADLEDSLERNYKRWSSVRKRLGEAGGALDGEVKDELARIGKLLCADLNAILDFLKTMHKYALEDHYGRYRYICQKLNV